MGANDQPKPSTQTLDPSSFKYRLAWKVFFYFSFLFPILFVLTIVGAENKNWVLFVSEFGKSIFILVALFGYAYCRKIFNRPFWIVVIAIKIVLDAKNFVSSGSSDLEISKGLIAGLFTMVSLESIRYFGLYLYAFKSNSLWLSTNQISAD